MSQDELARTLVTLHQPAPHHACQAPTALRLLAHEAIHKHPEIASQRVKKPVGTVSAPLPQPRPWPSAPASVALTAPELGADGHIADGGSRQSRLITHKPQASGI